MNFIRHIILGVVAGALHLSAHGQQRQYGAYHGELLKVSQAMKNARNLSYRYTFDAEFPNGQKDRLKGRMAVASDKKVLFNDNDAQTILYTDKWYYKADHRKKTVTVVNLAKHLNGGYKAAVESDVFQNGSLSIYLDSLICKYGNVRQLKRSNDTVWMEVGFPQQLQIKTVKLVYDEKRQMMISYSIKSFQSYRSYELGRDKGTTKIVSCDNFRQIARTDDYSTANFFALINDKVVLKKYNNYKLSYKL